MTIETLFKDHNRHIRFYLLKLVTKKRQELGVSQEEMALRLQLPAQTYKKLESGRVRIHQELFEQLRAELSLCEEELLDIVRIAKIAYANDLAKILSPNYPSC
ncbi:MAG TPA: helix-turn-helix transcriptional regulator [Bdellovibrio sp.]|nr:helix-turn-helix transcriptional regulator [Bdellovibrio sp.]